MEGLRACDILPHHIIWENCQRPFHVMSVPGCDFFLVEFEIILNRHCKLLFLGLFLVSCECSTSDRSHLTDGYPNKHHLLSMRISLTFQFFSRSRSHGRASHPESSASAQPR